MNWSNVKKWITEESGAEIYKLEHCYRLNGVVDVWRNCQTVFVIPEGVYHSAGSFAELCNIVRAVLESHPAQPPIKKLPTGRMSYKEFKNNRVHNKNTHFFTNDKQSK